MVFNRLANQQQNDVEQTSLFNATNVSRSDSFAKESQDKTDDNIDYDSIDKFLNAAQEMEPVDGSDSEPEVENTWYQTA